MRKHVYHMLCAQRDLLPPPAINGVTLAMNQLQDSIAKKFQPLIVRVGLVAALVRYRRMRQRLQQQFGVFKLVPDDLLQLLRLHDYRVAFACRGMLPPRTVLPVQGAKSICYGLNFTQPPLKNRG